MSEPLDLTGLPQRGDVVAGRYEVEGVIGSGGMGVVYAALDRQSGRKVALKCLLASSSRVPNAKERFLREARTMSAIRSEHVTRVLDVGTLDNGAPFMALELLDGRDFSEVLKQRGRLPVAEAVDLVLQAAEAIRQAHALGIVHRDLKPSNLFLTAAADRSPLVKVIDFGLSKVEPEAGKARDASLTATDFAMGSPFYMSPEQLRGLKHADARTDVWALGVILYELLAGKRPYDGGTLTAICASIAADTPEPLPSIRSDVPAELDAVVARCLEKDAKRRIQTIEELQRGLEPFGAGKDAVQVVGLSDPPPPVSSNAGLEAIPVVTVSEPAPAPISVSAPAAVPIPAAGPVSVSVSVSAPVSVPVSVPFAAPVSVSVPAPVLAPAANLESTAVIASWGRTRRITGSTTASLVGVAVAVVLGGGAFWLLGSQTMNSGPPAAAPAAQVVEAPSTRATVTTRPPAAPATQAPPASVPSSSASAAASAPPARPALPPRPPSAASQRPAATSKPTSDPANRWD